MKCLSLFLLLIASSLFIPAGVFCQEEEEEMETISIHEFLKMIEETEDSIFTLRHVQVSLGDSPLPLNCDPHQSDSIPILEINKKIELSDVIFHPGLAFKNIHFKEGFKIFLSRLPSFSNCTFDNEYNFENPSIPEIYKFSKADRVHDDYYSWPKAQVSIKNCVFYGNFFFIVVYDEYFSSSIFFEENQILYENTKAKVDRWGQMAFYIDSIENVIIKNNYICNSANTTILSFSNITELDISQNNFDLYGSEVALSNNASTHINKNTFYQPFVLTINNLETEATNALYQFQEYYNWEDFKGKIIDVNGLQSIYDQEGDFSREQIMDYQATSEFQDQFAYNSKMIVFGKFMNHYQNQHNREWANLVYQEMKDLQTKRFKFLYHENPSFQSYFKWKINQFLKIFSVYGTEPARSIVFSGYIILLFALVYIFFPNSWDERNKHRIMNRMLFFAKYFKKKEGMKEVFEEENKEKITVYEDFKTFMTNSKNEIPPYFDTLAKPIYNLSVANYKLRSTMLNNADILKGKWSELSKRRRFTTSVIMAFWLVGIIAYDIFVKFFNALMLSLNTFSTLGFGEIPIKGIPRYLAIIEGFLGWFMLTIFSVSLISQLIQL